VFCLCFSSAVISTGGVLAQLVETLLYTPEGVGLIPDGVNGIFFIDVEISIRNISFGVKAVGA
jgi:hypothetical protein